MACRHMLVGWADRTARHTAASRVHHQPEHGMPRLRYCWSSVSTANSGPDPHDNPTPKTPAPQFTPAITFSIVSLTLVFTVDRTLLRSCSTVLAVAASNLRPMSGQSGPSSAASH